MHQRPAQSPCASAHKITLVSVRLTSQTNLIKAFAGSAECWPLSFITPFFANSSQDRSSQI
jgi:hypothetical protein